MMENRRTNRSDHDRKIQSWLRVTLTIHEGFNVHASMLRGEYMTGDRLMMGLVVFEDPGVETTRIENLLRVVR